MLDWTMSLHKFFHTYFNLVIPILPTYIISILFPLSTIYCFLFCISCIFSTFSNFLFFMSFLEHTLSSPNCLCLHHSKRTKNTCHIYRNNKTWKTINIQQMICIDQGKFTYKSPCLFHEIR